MENKNLNILSRTQFFPLVKKLIAPKGCIMAKKSFRGGNLEESNLVGIPNIGQNRYYGHKFSLSRPDPGRREKIKFLFSHFVVPQKVL